MKYTYKCDICDAEKEIEHSVDEITSYEALCIGEVGSERNTVLHDVTRMRRVIHPSLIIWKGGSPSETE